MNILLTNDDGFGSQGLMELYEELSKDHNVFILAPSGNRSAVSHCITMHKSLELEKKDCNMYTCSGYPADCTITALRSSLFPVKFDVVISGINRGANLGTDIVYSGTCAGARQAVMYGIPGIAVSVEKDSHDEKEYQYTAMAVFIKENLDMLISQTSVEVPYLFCNVNGLSCENYKGMEVSSSLSVRSYFDDILIKEENGKILTVFCPASPETKTCNGSDYDIISRGCISVSSVYAEPLVFSPKSPSE